MNYLKIINEIGYSRFTLKNFLKEIKENESPLTIDKDQESGHSKSVNKF